MGLLGQDWDPNSESPEEAMARELKRRQQAEMERAAMQQSQATMSQNPVPQRHGPQQDDGFFFSNLISTIKAAASPFERVYDEDLYKRQLDAWKTRQQYIDQGNFDPEWVARRSYADGVRQDVDAREMAARHAMAGGVNSYDGNAYTLSDGQERRDSFNRVLAENLDTTNPRGQTGAREDEYIARYRRLPDEEQRRLGGGRILSDFELLQDFAKNNVEKLGRLEYAKEREGGRGEDEAARVKEAIKWGYGIDNAIAATDSYAENVRELRDAIALGKTDTGLIPSLWTAVTGSSVPWTDRQGVLQYLETDALIKNLSQVSLGAISEAEMSQMKQLFASLANGEAVNVDILNMVLKRLDSTKKDYEVQAWQNYSTLSDYGSLKDIEHLMSRSTYLGDTWRGYGVTPQPKSQYRIGQRYANSNDPSGNTELIYKGGDASDPTSWEVVTK